ncbi:MAG: HU family DNA-binding protein [Candidatus Eremiobacteraeota bacterium]|nr:HU family DNA-binding protein [Candidatus Eremiobacteraeota bacterium]
MPETIIGKKDLVNAIAEKGEFTKKKTEIMLNAFLETINQELARGNTIRIIPFGTFEVRKREARMGRNPRTGEEIKIKARNVPVFKPGKGLKDVVN